VKAILDVFDGKEWMGGKQSKVLLLLLSETKTTIDPDLSTRICQTVMKQVLALSDDELKKEVADVMGSIVDALERIMDKSNKKDDAFAFRLKLSLKYIQSSSLPQRLFGWEQIPSLVDSARRSRPAAQAYMLQGCGSHEVDGIYTKHGEHDGTPKYVRESDSGLELTLFRCTMRSNSKQWFISNADRDKPGTDRDVDYYHQLSEENCPPQDGWVKDRMGQHPPPTCHPVKSETEEEEQDTLETKIVQWAIDEKLLEDAFGDRMHREVVSRSVSLIRFLAVMNALEKETLEKAWETAMAKSDVMKEHILTMLAEVTVDLSPQLVVHFMSVVTEASLNDGFVDAVTLTEKLASGNIRMLLAKGGAVTDAVLSLLWALQQNPRLTEKPQELITFFKDVLCTEAAASHREKFLRECIQELEKSASCSEKGAYEEKAAMRAIELIPFILETYTAEGDQATAVDRLNTTFQLVALLFRELEAYQQRTKAIPVKPLQIAPRLQLIRVVHGLGPKTLELSASQVGAIWKMLPRPEEREECLKFLCQAGVKAKGLANAFNLEVCFEAFNELICKETDFRQLGTSGFQCFRTYFLGLNKHDQNLTTVASNLHDIMEVRTLELNGLDALWKVTVESSDVISDDAKKLLLSVYECLDDTTVQTNSHFVERIFAFLSDPNAAPFYPRCLQLISAFVSSSSSTSLAHGASGRGKPLTVKVEGRRLRPQAVGHGGQKQQQSPIYLPMIEIQVHSKETLQSLADKIAKEVDHPENQTSLLIRGKQLKSSSSTMAELFIEDGTTITAVLAAAVTPKYQDRPSDALTDPGTIIAMTDKYFDILLNLMQSEEKEISSSVWALLMAVPTNQKLLARMANMGHEVDGVFSRVDWTSSFQTALYYSSIYTMQVVDAQLLPADDRDLGAAVKWRRDFVQNGGFEHVLRFFMDGDFVNKPGQSVVLRIVRCCLFGSSQASSQETGDDDVPASPTAKTAALADFDYPSLLRKLVFVVSQEQENDTEQSAEVLMDAVCTIECILVQKQVSDVFLQIDGVNHLLVDTLLGNPHEEVRQQIGSSLYPTVVSDIADEGLWYVMDLLIQALSTMDSSSSTGQQYFELLNTLIPNAANRAADAQALLQQLLSKLQSISNEQSADVLVGCLNVLSKLFVSHPDVVVHLKPTGTFSTDFFNRFLFVVPALDDKDRWPLCRTPESRQAAFDVLGALAQSSAADRLIIVELLKVFNEDVPQSVSADWNYEPNFAKKADCGFVGLKNQGCTCYMNALLQQLYMVPTLREGVQNAKVTEDQSEVSLEELVGRRIKIVYSNEKEYEANVVNYEPDSNEHTVRYDNGQENTYVLNEGRNQKETGKYTVLKPPLSEPEGAMNVLVESKKSFWYLSDSQMRFYDPRPFVDACKVLNMAFDVYQQNDTREFLDKLLEKWEMAMKGTPQAKCLTQCFNGATWTQKTSLQPLEGEEACRKSDGRPEQFVQLDLEIGHPSMSHNKRETIYESLAAYTEGTIMDGENQVEWEVNGIKEKKDTIMRTVIGRLPNLLLLHLRRFDLDYNTFEPFKINSRCSFPMTLYMKPFTNEGIEAREAAAQAEAMQQSEVADVEKGEESDTLPDSPTPQVRQPTASELAADVASMSEEDMDPNYVYKFAGAVIHSGYAQGGHYYSFIKDRSSDKWYKFDDDTVTEFDPANLERECFGGYQNRSQTTLEYGKWVTQDVEVESMSNALILFYEKVVPIEHPMPPAQSNDEEVVTPTPPTPAEPVAEEESTEKNTDATVKTVWDANSTFVRTSYLLDTDFHNFQLKLLQQGCDASQEDALGIIKMGTAFLFNVLLHGRDKSGVKAWVRALQKLYEQNQEACYWLLAQLTGPMHMKWMHDVLFECFSPQARSALADLTAHAVQWLVPKERDVLIALTAQPEEDSDSMIVQLLKTMVSLLGDAANHWKNFDQYFTLWLRLAEVDEAVRAYMCSKNDIALLANFFLGPKSPIRQHFPAVSRSVAEVLGPNYGPLLQAISALVGVPIVRRAALLEDECVVFSQDAKLSQAATHALTGIFNKFASNQDGVMGMSSHDINKYFNACGVYDNVTFFANRIATILKEHPTTTDDRLSLAGLLSFYTDAAWKEEELVWKDLRKHGWREDLRHESEVAVPELDEIKTTPLPALSQEVLLSEEFYEAGVNEKAANELSMMTTFLCRGSREISASVIQALLHRLQAAPGGWKGERLLEGCIASVASLVDREDALQEERLFLTMESEFGILTVARKLSKSQEEIPVKDTYKMIKNLLTLKKKSTACAAWLESKKEEWSWMVDWLKDASLQSALGFTPGFGRHYSKMETLRTLTETHGGESVNRFPHENNSTGASGGDSFRLTGAGTDFVNGIYEYAGVHDLVPMYTKRSGTRALTLYRCALQSGVKRWYISDVVSQTPGTSADIDFYWAAKELLQGDPTPPREGWQTCKPTSTSEGGLDPPPLIQSFVAEESSNGDVGGVSRDLEAMDI